MARPAVACSLPAGELEHVSRGLSDAGFPVFRAANAAAYYGLNNGGQVCISIERVYVEAPVYDRFVERLVDVVKGLRQGGPAAAGEVEVGAITHPPQLDIIESHVTDALAKGASALTGGRPCDGGGRYYEPTVLAGVDHTMDCMREETFGPTVLLVRALSNAPARLAQWRHEHDAAAAEFFADGWLRFDYLLTRAIKI